MTSFYRISESRMLPPEMWNKILYHAFIGREGPDTDTLENCRKVCKEWKEMIKSFVWKKPNKEWGIITKSMIEKNWVISFLESFPTEKMIAHAKSLGKSRKNKIPYKLWLSFFLLLVEMEGILSSGVMTRVAGKVESIVVLGTTGKGNLPVITCYASLAYLK